MSITNVIVSRSHTGISTDIDGYVTSNMSRFTIATAENVAATAKKTTERVAETAKKASTTVKKAAAKKAPAKKELSHENTSVTIEFAGRQVAAKEVVAKAKAAFEAAHEGVEVKTLELYIKPEENVAYYVVNGEGADDFKVEL